MAFGHGKDEVVIVNGRNVSSYLSAAGVTHEKETAETTTFGKASKTRIAGLVDGGISLEGFYDGAALASDEIFQQILGQGAKVFKVWPQGDAVGAIGRAMEALETSYEVTGDVGAAVGISAEAEATGGAERVTSLHSVGTAVTGDGNGATVDNGAASSDGGAAYLSVVSKAGGTSLQVTLMHSTDNFALDNTLLGTFALASAAGVAERIALAGTIKQYVRAVFDETGAGSWNLNAALHRN